MPRVPVFYSFCYDDDALRVQQVRNMGAFDGNSSASPNEWESIRSRGDAAIQRWIDEAMNYRQCVIVLVGSRTSERRWVRYEIEKAHRDGRGLFGIYIHNLRCPQAGTCAKGSNPFSAMQLNGYQMFSDKYSCYEPEALYPYTDIQQRMQSWIGHALLTRNS